MGSGIAQLCLEAGFETIAPAGEPGTAEEARERIAHFLTRKVEKGLLAAPAREAALARLSLTTELDELGECDLVVEAVFEDLSLKREVFAALGRVCAPDTILATNTSALSVTEIAVDVAGAERVVGMHFF